MNNLAAALHAFSPLNAQAIEDLGKSSMSRQFAKGEVISEAGRICRHLYFLQQGLVKLYFDNGDKEFVMRFFSEESIFTGLDSYISETSSTYSIMALEPATVHSISRSRMEQLCVQHHCIETAFRKFISMAAFNMMGRVSEMLEEEAAARYDSFIRAHAALMQRISLGDLAAYLGITQVSLSRIRGKR
ncbi:hypothetical protein C7T94_14495 [Pedobacter yulinensis]|uniref:Cyclic nucleotide-binding domain-containing protein n=1 Tax=Pedobacter yulinensis TaxID=2126353 RepID=A0A2T3HMQ7_9SPHI|nr:Crp/Fnr family transcriptional regulator [Pedobacter yulinensis]PST83725.1 hypothetical protein C7T94_14495 [Pedobacter yulinensis]